jgi:RNA-directed DNA polymerase
LKSIYEVDFLDVSWGYRPRRCAQAASKGLCGQLYAGRYHHVVEADIRSFFDKIDHDKLLKMLTLRINDGALLGLIQQWLRAGILEEDGQVINPVSGSPQGGIISPILANVYLHYALDVWFETEVRSQVQGQALMMRYADDFVCAFEHRDEAEAFMKELPRRLEQYGLELAAEKTNLIRFSRFGIRDRSKKAAWVPPQVNGHFSFLGFQYQWTRSRAGKAILQRRTDPEKLRKSIAGFSDWIRGHRHRRLPWIMATLRSKWIGYMNYYGVTGNMPQLDKFWRLAQRLLYKWLNRRSHKKSFTWRQLYSTLKRYDVPNPRLIQTA